MALDWDALVLAPVHAIFGANVGAGGKPVSVSWDGNAPYPVPDAVFDRTYIVTQGDGRAPVAGVHPTLGLRQSSLPSGVTMRQGDGVQVGDDAYRVVDVQADNMGHVLLILAGA